MAAHVYLMTNRPHGILYIGVTSNIARRAWEHREGAVEGFTSKYDLKRLVFVETHDGIAAAIRRERTMKTWRRAWKVRLIEAANRHGTTSTTGWHSAYDGGRRGWSALADHNG